MRFKAFIMLGLVFTASVEADEQLPTLRVGGETYSNVFVTTITTTDIYFTYNHGRGMANAKLKSLSPELQNHFHYDPVKGSQTEKLQAQANAEYYQKVKHARAATTASHKNPSYARTVAHASDLNWTTDFSQALERARQEDKRVLLDFTGSDWCPWCIKFDHEVLSTDQFATYAQSKLELVRVDFPRTKPQDDALKQANQALAQRYNVSGYPTFVLVNYAGNELGRQSGYAAGGPRAFIARLEKFAGQ